MSLTPDHTPSYRENFWWNALSALDG